MKNNAKRLLAFLLAALLCVTMVVPAFATEADAAHDHDHKVSCDADCTHECDTDHKNSEVIEVVESVCTAAGYTLKYCFDCEHYFVADVKPAEAGAAHNPGEKVEEGKAATCVSEGVETSYKCTVCGELCDKDGGKVDKLEIIDHEYKDGLCVICGKHEDDSCTGTHTWEFVEVSVKPTATTNGTAKYKCTVCGAIKEVVILAENARFYPSSLYADIEFNADGTMVDRLGKLELTLKGATISETDVTFNKTTLKLPTLNVTAGGQQGLATFKEFTAATIGDFWNDADGFSFEALFINRAQSGTQGIFCSTEGAGLGLATIKAGTNAGGVPGLCTYVSSTTWKYTNGTTAVSTTEYTHVISTAVVDATGLHTAVYVNGELAAKGDFAGADIYTEAAKYIPFATQFSIGSDVGYEFKNTNFSVADIKVYGSALTQEDVTMLYGYVVEDFTEKEVVDELAWVKEILAENNLSIEGYDVLELSPAMHSFWNSKDTSKHSTIINASNNTAKNHPNFWATEVFENAEIPAGSLLVVKEGYQYRPDGWQEFGKVNSAARPDNVKDALTLVNTAWYGNFTSRAFNVSRVDGTALTEADLGSFVILVPKTHTCSKDTLTAKPAVAGTCTEKGTIAHYECSCGKLYADAEAKTLITSIEGDFGHSYGDKATTIVPATCLTWGYELWHCEDCGTARVVTEGYEPKGHANWDDEDRATIISKTDATCTKDGEVEWTCNDCGTKFDKVLTKTGCTLVTVNVDATCYTYAYTFTYCTNANCDATAATVADDYIVTVDGKTYNVVEFKITGNTLDPENHYNIKTDVVKEATCTTPGTKVTYCEGCHAEDIYFEYELEGHVYDYENEELVSAATCVAAAQYKALCKHCKVPTVYSKGEALGHKYGDVQTTDATCAAKGEKYKVCSVCTDATEGHKVVVEVLEYKSSAVNGIYSDLATAAKEHEIVPGSMVDNYRPGSCTLVGLVKYTCKTCGDIFVQTGVGGTGHDYETVTPGLGATCTEDGYTAVEKCKVCGHTTVSVKIDKLGHTMTEVVAKDATCDEDGDVAHFHCATCGKNFEDAEGKTEITTAVVIPALGHKFVAGVCTVCDYACEHKLDLIKISLAACASDDKGTYGYKHFGCEECGYECWTNFVDIPEHVFVEKETAADCTHTGKVWEECACGKTQNEVIIPETHYNVDGDPIIDSCLDAEEDRLCDKCGETIGKAHNEITTVVDNTCTTLGYTIVACGDCGEVISTVANTTLGEHKWVEASRTEATYAKEGSVTYTCSACQANKTETLEKKSGLNIKLEVTNKYNFKDYVDGSYVVVKVLADANNVNAWSFKFTLGYNEAVLNYVKEESAVATTICGTTTSGLINAENGVAKVLGYASNDADAKMQNVVLNGDDIVLATLVFRVDSDVEVSNIAFTVDEVEIVNKVGDDVDEDLGTDLTVSGATISTQLYLDINNDGVIDLEDLNSMAKIMANEVPADSEIIEAAADANHDGTIGEADLSILLNALVK